MIKSFDEWKLIVQTTSRDGGDSLHRMGMYHLGVELRKQLDLPVNEYAYCEWYHYKHAMKQLYCGNGNYRRHADKKEWYSDCDRMSRDQMIPNMILWGMRDKDRLRDFGKHHLKRWGLFTNTRHNHVYKSEKDHLDAIERGKIGSWTQWNHQWKYPDWITPNVLAIYIRGFEIKWLYPVLCILDIELVLMGLKHRFTKEHDVVNHLCAEVQAKHVMPTPVSWFAHKILPKKVRMDKLTSYFGNDGPVWLGKLYWKLIERL